MNSVADIPISLVFEGVLDEAVLRRLLRETQRPYEIETCYNSQGFGNIKKNINAYNNSAKGIPYLVMTDLDQEECPPQKLQSWLKGDKHPNLLFRIAVREVEAWLLGSRRTFAEFIGIEAHRIQALVEEIDDPKKYLINLVRRSPNRDLREDITRPGAKKGPDYNGRLAQFVQNYWDPVEAQENSPSLRKAIRALEEFQPCYETG